MYCQKCGHQNPEDAKFCLSCGRQFDQASTTVSSSSYQNADAQKQGHTRTKAISTPTILILLIALVILVGVGIAAYLYGQSSRQSESKRVEPSSVSPPRTASAAQEQNQRSSNTVATQEHKINGSTLISKTFVVGARQYYSVKFSIPTELGSARAVGHFSASGGTGNDIAVFITGEEGLTNFKNGHSPMVAYQSGRVTVGNIDIPLQAGDYYIVFSNTFSLVSNKAVTADVNLKY